MKTCSRCKISKEKNEFGPHKSRADGLNVWCKDCARQEIKKHRDKVYSEKYGLPIGERKPRGQAQAMPNERWCSRCKISKEKNEFGKNKHKKSGYHDWCRSCAREASKKLNDKKYAEKYGLPIGVRKTKIRKTKIKQHSMTIIRNKIMSVAKRNSNRQKMITKYGIDFVETAEQTPEEQMDQDFPLYGAFAVNRTQRR